MANEVEVENLTEIIFQYLSRNGESSARRIAQDLDFEKTIINSVLYRNTSIFQSEGGHPPLWSLRNIELTREGSDPKLIDLPNQNPNEKPSDSLDSSDADQVTFRESRDPTATFHALSDPSPRKTSTPDSILQAIVEDEQLTINSYTQLDVDVVLDVEDLVKRFPGLTVDEISVLLGISPEEVSIGIRRVRHLVIVTEEQDDRLTDSEIGMLAALADASTMAFPLSTDDYDDLVRRGFVKGKSAVRVIQVFGSWRRACELAGVEAPRPMREHYDRRWTNRELAETVSRFLIDSEYRGAHHRYDEWRDKNMNVDEIPSSGTLKNYLGRTWRTVQNRGLEILREQWLLDSEKEAND